MSATGDGAADYLTTASTIAAPTIYSFAFWYYALHVPGAGFVSELLSLTSSTTFEIDFIWDHTSGVYRFAVAHVNSNGSPNSVVNLPGTAPTNAWTHYAATFDGTTIRCYQNGSLVSSGAANGSPGPSQGNPNVWLFAYKGPLYFLDGSLAQVGIWNVTLSADDVKSIFAGTDPTSVQGASMIFFDGLDTVGGTIGPSLTNTGCVINQTYFTGTNEGGFAFGGTMPVAAIYAVSMTGGFSFGGSGIAPAIIFTVGMTGGFAFGGTMPAFVTYNVVMTGGFAFGGTGFSPSIRYVSAMEGGFACGGNRFDTSVLTPGNAFVIAHGRAKSLTQR